MCRRWMCGYSIDLEAAIEGRAARRARRPSRRTAAGVTGPVGAIAKRTVCASSARSKRTCADGGVTVQPCGASSATSASAAPGALLVTVTRISRVLGGRVALLVRCGPGRRRDDHDVGGRAHRQRRHHRQLHALLAAEDVALVRVLHRHATAAPARRQRSARAPRRTAWAGTADRTAHPHRTCTGRPRRRGASRAPTRGRSRVR